MNGVNETRKANTGATIQAMSEKQAKHALSILANYSDIEVFESYTAAVDAAIDTALDAGK